MAVAALLLAVAPVWPMAMVAAVLLGAGYGVYLSVDAALITEVLPAATNRAKDLGVINIANSAPQVLGPALSAPIVCTWAATRPCTRSPRWSPSSAAPSSSGSVAWRDG